MLRQVGQLLGRHRDADALQFGFQLRQLVRLSLAFVGDGIGRNAQEGDGQDDGFEQGRTPDE